MIVVSVVVFQTTRAARTDAIVDQVVANRVRSLLAAQLVDVVSPDQHTVKPWFDGKIDFAPAVRDLSANGFPLVGGRLDYLEGKTVVALVYQQNKPPINLVHHAGTHESEHVADSDDPTRLQRLFLDQ